MGVKVIRRVQDGKTLTDIGQTTLVENRKTQFKNVTVTKKEVEVAKPKPKIVIPKATIKDRIQIIKDDMALQREKSELISNWCKVMAHCKKYNCTYDTFEIVDETKTQYGWWFRLYAPNGLSFDELDTLRPTIQHNLGCTFIHEVHSSNIFATCKIIYEKLIKCNEIPFAPVKVEPYQICPGVDVTGKAIIIDVNLSPQILIAGQTGTGKNGAADSIILNWLNSCNEKEIELYMFQCAKIDLSKYKLCKQVKSFVMYTFDQMKSDLDYIVEEEIPRRLRLFEDMFTKRTGEGIYDYNELHPDSKLPYIYVIVDEFLELMIQSKSKKEENDIKNEILDYMQRIAQMGRAVGVQYMIIHQKPEKAFCPTFIKNMSSIRICFGFRDESCGRIVLGDGNGALVTRLPDRRAYVDNNGKLDLMFTTNLKDKRDMYIKPHEVIKQKTEEVKPKPIEEVVVEKPTVKPNAGTAILPPKPKNIPKQEEIKPKEDNHQIKIDEIIAKNIKNIPNFVPYEPRQGDKKPIIIIDPLKL